MHPSALASADTGSSNPKVISNSSMWQSERWNRAVTKISEIDGLLGAMLLAFRLIHQRGQYDAVYTVGIRQSQMYGLLCAIFGTGGRPHIATEILLDEMRPGSLLWRAKRALQRMAFRKTANVIVFSSGERELYSWELNLPLERVRFVPFHTNIQQPRSTPLGRSYGFAAGRSLRDYKTLFAAVEGIDFPFVVVADRASVAHLHKPGNIALHCDVSRDRYLELLEGSRFAVVPLAAEFRSTGQVVLLEAASLGKPVIASDVVGVRDYISHGVDGLLVAPGNPESLRESIQTLIADDDLARRLARSAMQRVRRDHMFSTFAAECLQVIADACQRSGRLNSGVPIVPEETVSQLTEESLLQKELT